MIDLHNHILPSVDDGADSFDEAMQMARQAAEVGTTIMAATPHRFWPGRDAPASWVTWHRIRLQRQLDKARIPITLVDGTEIPIGPHIAQMLAENRLARLGGPTGTHALIEPPFDRVPRNAVFILKQVIAEGIIPILAHPERNAEIQQDMSFLELCAEMGVIMQVTTGSIMGHFNAPAELAARRILCREDWQVLIASDAHSAGDRSPSLLKRAADRVVEWTGDPVRAMHMVTEIPAACIPTQLPSAAEYLAKEPPDSAHA